MNIIFEDEYSEELASWVGEVPPRIGEFVTIEDEEYRVKSVNWIIDYSDPRVIVTITQNLIKASKDDPTSGRLNKMDRAIVGLTEEVSKQGKKGRILSEQLTSVRTYLRTKKG
jgi:hypothetical protein